VAFDSHALTAHNHSDNDNHDHDETLLYDGNQKEFIDQENHEHLYKHIQQNPEEQNAKNNYHIPSANKTFKEENSLNNTIKISKDEKLTTLSKFNNNNDHNEHSHLHHDHNQCREENIATTLKNGVQANANVIVHKNNNNVINVDNFALNESENADNLDQNIDEDKHTTRPRVNTFDYSKIGLNKMRKQLSGVLHKDISKQQKKQKKIMAHRKSSVLDANCQHDHHHNNDSDSDLDEATLKNVVSSKGKFLSLLQARNISKVFLIFLVN